MHVWAYTDWMLRPRTPEELDLAQGGGVPYRQGPHQIDTLRLLGGGMIRSVRGTIGQWFAGRPISGYYSAYIEFENGTPATLMHNGYGYFLASELVPWGTDKSRYTYEERTAIRKQLLDGSRDESTAKDAMRIGGAQEREIFRQRGGRRAWIPNDLGILIASCDRGDIRQSQWGLYVYRDSGVEDVSLPEEGWSRRAELEELYGAVVLEHPVRHTGAWGMATLEVCLAIIESARERREIFLSHQVPWSD
jgi:phthalate 4,5-cis-dihydrodiol dehydrogenase